MFQSFYWDSYQDTQWTNLTSQADTLAKYFDLVWVPQSGYCNSLTNQMGYADIWWFNQKSAFGTADPEGADFRACGNYGPMYKKVR